MPAPSPARGSAPTAPRCSRLTRMVSASSTILCDLRPLISAINPTPQESFSSAGSNRPKPDALIVVLALPAGTPRACSGAGAIHPAQVRVPLRARAINSFWRQPSCRSKACGCFFAAVRRALALPAADPRAPPPDLPPLKGARREEWPRAMRVTNWDSNAVLCRTWQIPGDNTRAEPSRARRKGRYCTDPTRIAATFRSSKWTTGTERAQWSIAAAPSDDVEHHRLGDGLTGILREQVVLAGL